MFSYYPRVVKSLKFVEIDLLFMTCWSVRSTHQLLVPDSGSVCSLERAASATGAQRDQQETPGEKQRETVVIFLVKYLTPCVCAVSSFLCLCPQSVWVRKGALRWWRDWKPQRWVDVSVALEQSTKCDGRKDSIFFVYYMQYDEKKVCFWCWIRGLLK